MKPITARQQQTLDFIKKFMASNDYSPSMRTIMEDVPSYHSTSCVKRDLVALERLGLIERMPNKARSIRFVEQGEPVIDPKLAIAVKALEWYANEKRYKQGDYEGGVFFSHAERDNGQRAITALEEIRKVN